MVRRVYITRGKEFRQRDQALCTELRQQLGLEGLQEVRLYHCYDIEHLGDAPFKILCERILQLPGRDEIVSEIPASSWVLGVQMHEGQFDQRAAAINLSLRLLSQDTQAATIKCATFYSFMGELSAEEKQRIRKYLINPVEAKEASLSIPERLTVMVKAPSFPPVLEHFRFSQDHEHTKTTYQLAMDIADLEVVRQHFLSIGRDPTYTELRVIDTYWSDHCRHTTFLTNLDDVIIDDPEIAATYASYLEARNKIGRQKPVSLMDLATIVGKVLHSQGKLENLDVSEEINACSVHISVDTPKGKQPYLLQFKNETHNHPTEIEPFGGAATCIGGAIRDPLSGRAYVYQAMRISGSADPRTPFSQTMEGKLPQRTIAQRSAQGYSSYGNQIGLATGLVEEVYHPNFMAKHMELGFVLGCVPQSHVRRESPIPGDIVVLVGGRTGRDGCGGATGSSKEHDPSSLESCGAEVQKGNAPEERKLQRLMKNPEATKMIKRCNDFGAGGVSVAIGELAPGLLIDLDAIPVKYEGLDGTERAISESQERMAMVVSAADAELFIHLAEEENLEATIVARVTESPCLVMMYQGRKLVELDRKLLDSNGAEKHAKVLVPRFKTRSAEKPTVFDETALKQLLGNLNVASKQPLAQRFDSTIGATTLHFPFGGMYQRTPTQSLAALIPLAEGTSSTASLASWGYDPYLMSEQPYQGAFWAVVHSLAKVVASGGSLGECYLSFQEYFGRVGSDPARWGIPFAALLGAYKAQMLFSVAAIGGKDSMSGSFLDIDVPPTLVSFAVSLADKSKLVSPEFKQVGSRIVLLACDKEEDLPSLFAEVGNSQALSIYALGFGGIAEAVVKMSIGNRIGCELDTSLDLQAKRYGAFLLELAPSSPYKGIQIGRTIAAEQIQFPLFSQEISQMEHDLLEPLASVYGTVQPHREAQQDPCLRYTKRLGQRSHYPRKKPRVLLPVFEGTNCEYDIEWAWKHCGAEPRIMVINTMSPKRVTASIQQFSRLLEESEILFLSGGFSASDEPDGSGKLIATFLRNELIAKSLHTLLENRDGLVGGICNGFQALIQVGLLPHGRITEPQSGDPLLIENIQGHHISSLVRCRVASVLSPWMGAYQVGDTQLLPISHGEGNFYAPMETLQDLEKHGMIATQYVDEAGNPFAPNGSVWAIEGISSKDGKVFGRMAHSERAVAPLYTNTPCVPDAGLFWGAVRYFS
ncbi:MAG: phosphoribosylformylglycinamidine synthase [Sphaerochaetaceae bacterium]